jgi:hypothetical protein
VLWQHNELEKPRSPRVPYSKSFLKNKTTASNALKRRDAIGCGRLIFKSALILLPLVI